MSEVKQKRKAAWRRRKRRVRKGVAGTAGRPRLTVFRSHKNIYAQIVNDDEGRTLVAASSLKDSGGETPEELAGKCALAYQVGRQLGERAKEQGIEQVVFDRNGFLYHGRVAALARGVREVGIKF